MAHENIGREDLNPIEEAMVYDEFVSIHKLSIDETAERCGTTAANVRARLDLLRLVPEAQDLVRRDILPITHANELAKVAPRLQREALRLIGKTAVSFVQFKQYLTQLVEGEMEPLSLTDLWIEQVESAADQQKALRARKAAIITSDALPQVVADRRDTAGDIVVRYMRGLADAGHEEAAAAVGNLLTVLLKFRKVKNFREFQEIQVD